MYTKLLILIVSGLLSGCFWSEPEVELPTNHPNFTHNTISKDVLNMFLPPEAYDAVERGNRWITFKYTDKCFLARVSFRSSVMTEIQDMETCNRDQD